jgi:ion channel
LTARLVLQNLTLGIVLVCFTVLVQVWLSLFVVRLFRRFAPSAGSQSSFAIRVVAVTILVLAILLGHLAQVYVWALVFYLLAFFDDFWSAQYFVGETYTTLGYGDLLLPPERRMLAGWLAITGLLMIGWSTALFAYLITRYLEARMSAFEPGDRRRL